RELNMRMTMQTSIAEMTLEKPGGAIVASKIRNETRQRERDSCPFGTPHQAGDVVLRDGSTVRVRPVRPEDNHALLFQSLSEESRWLRFLSLAKGSALQAEAHRETNLDHTFGLLALSGPDKRASAMHSMLNSTIIAPKLRLRLRMIFKE